MASQEEILKSNEAELIRPLAHFMGYLTSDEINVLGLQLGDVPEQTRVVGLHLRNLLGLGRLFLVLRGGLFQ